MKKRFYISTLWVATLMILVSTVMIHHHHFREVCTIVEECMLDGNENDEHTEHHENEGEENGCCIQQMHSFLVNVKTTHDIEYSLIPLPYVPLVAFLWDTLRIPTVDASSYTLLYIEPCKVLSEVKTFDIDHRGPPCL